MPCLLCLFVSCPSCGCGCGCTCVGWFARSPLQSVCARFCGRVGVGVGVHVWDGSLDLPCKVCVRGSVVHHDRDALWCIVDRTAGETMIFDYELQVTPAVYHLVYSQPAAQTSSASSTGTTRLFSSLTDPGESAAGPYTKGSGSHSEGAGAPGEEPGHRQSQSTGPATAQEAKDPERSHFEAVKSEPLGCVSVPCGRCRVEDSWEEVARRLFSDEDRGLHGCGR